MDEWFDFLTEREQLEYEYRIIYFICVCVARGFFYFHVSKQAVVTGLSFSSSRTSHFDPSTTRALGKNPNPDEEGDVANEGSPEERGAENTRYGIHRVSCTKQRFS